MHVCWNIKNASQCNHPVFSEYKGHLLCPWSTHDPGLLVNSAASTKRLRSRKRPPRCQTSHICKLRHVLHCNKPHL